MAWFETVDVDLFRLINERLSHPVLDRVMPFFSGNPYFIPALALFCGWLIWKGGTRARLFLAMMFIIIAFGDMLVISTIKGAIGRARPFDALDGVHLLVGRGPSGSMPSSHASTWFAATLIAFVYYRRSLCFMLPLACLVGMSRIYVGVHYPGDVLAGAILGCGYASAGLWLLESFWRGLGAEWFPEWVNRLPSLVNPREPEPVSPAAPVLVPASDGTLRRLGYLVIALLFVARLVYQGSGRIELSEDESYQWLWSKHLALSYFSKPPLIAYAQFLGTSLWGDREFGVRFFSPVIAAILSLVLFRFLGRVANVRAALMLVLIVNATPLPSVGATLMTVDPLSVLFWTLTMVAGWRAVQAEATTRDWLWVGCWMGLGFLSKYTALFQWLCWAVFFVLWRPARAQLRRPGPYLALLVNLVCLLPVVIWNAQHDWITAHHVADNGALGQPWHPTLRFFLDFLVVECVLLHPIFFVATVWAAMAIWRRQRGSALAVYFFSMGAPLFLFYFAYTLHSRVLPNWIAPSILPLFCLMVVYWDGRWREGVRAVKSWLAAGCWSGYVLVIVLHDTNLIAKATGHYLPAAWDPLRRVRAWSETARLVGAARDRLLAEGKPVFIIGDHYGITGEISFYLPQARERVKDIPLAYHLTSDRPKNQFYFWPGYREQRRGENAIFVVELEMPKKPLRSMLDTYLPARADEAEAVPAAKAAPAELQAEFASVTDLGPSKVLYRGRVFRWIQLFECRDLR
jgi:4-amino-4-deoxy-L-arabinose transferase-like glycosyltransferase/membrane-associated phospholipid phosphatase